MNQPIARHRIIAGFVALGSFLLAILNEMCQRLVESGLLQDRLVFDYMTDAMAVPIVAGTLISWRDRLPLWVLGAVAGIFTLIEAFSWPDPYDMLLYWVGAGIIHVALNRQGSCA